MGQYVHSLDGGNKGLRELVGKKGPDYRTEPALRAAGGHAAEDRRRGHLDRESYWKDVLLSRQFGLKQLVRDVAPGVGLSVRFFLFFFPSSVVVDLKSPGSQTVPNQFLEPVVYRFPVLPLGTGTENCL